MAVVVREAAPSEARWGQVAPSANTAAATDSRVPEAGGSERAKRSGVRDLDQTLAEAERGYSAMGAPNASMIHAIQGRILVNAEAPA